MSNPKDYRDVLAGIRARQKQASGDQEAVHGMKDPANKGTVTPPDHPDGDSDKKKNLPASATNESHEGEQLTDKDTNPSSTGENVPGPVADGNTKEDAANSPTVPLSKIAKNISGVMEGIKNLQNKSAAAPAAPAKKTEETKSAGTEDVAGKFEFTPEFHIKLASLILETEEGTKYAQELLRKAAGAEKAQELISAALNQQQVALEYAAYNDDMAKRAAYQQAQQEAAFEQLYKSASVEERKQIDKFASVHGAVLQILPTDFEKHAYMGGADAGAGMMEQEAAGQEPSVPGGGEEPLGMEDIVAILESLVAEGKIQPEEAQAIAEQLMGGEGGAGPEGGAPPAEQGLPEEAKAASDLFRKLVK